MMSENGWTSVTPKELNRITSRCVYSVMRATQHNTKCIAHMSFRKNEYPSSASETMSAKRERERAQKK